MAPNQGVDGSDNNGNVRRIKPDIVVILKSGLEMVGLNRGGTPKDVVVHCSTPLME